MVKTYTTTSVEKKLLCDAMKDKKSVTTKRRRLKKVTVVEEEHVDVIHIDEGERDIVAAVTDKRRKKY